MVTEVTVTFPLLYTTPNMTQYYKYGIGIKTNDSAFNLKHSLVWRRYSEFSWLRKNIKSHHYDVLIPKLPTQGIFEDRSHPLFIENRRHGLELFIKILLSNRIFKSSKVLHLFLQTSLTTQEISETLSGIRHDEMEVTKQDLPDVSIYEYAKLDREETFEATVLINGEDEDNDKRPKTSLLKTHRIRSEAKQIKRVTFCEQVRIFTLQNASPNSMVVI